MKKVLFVFNPKSGKGQIRNKLLDIVDVFSRAGYELTIYATGQQGDAVRIIKQHGKNKNLIVCSGGDGTLNEVVSGIMSLDVSKRPILGYIPSGSTNDFAASLGISKNMRRASEDVVTGSDIALDVGCFGSNRYFVYVAAFGAFTEVSYTTTQESKNFLGHQAYMLEAVKRVTNLKSYHMRFEWDGKQLEEDFILGMITNTISIGGFKSLAGMDVALDDGEFEVLLVRTPRTPKDITSIVSFLLVKDGENDCVYTFRAKKLKIISDESVDWSLDGEFGGSQTEVEIENLQKEIVLRSHSKIAGKIADLSKNVETIEKIR